MAKLHSFASSTFKSLQIRNYRYYFFGQGVSLSGTWMQTVALSWLVLDLSQNSGFAIGLVLALQFLPTLLFGAWGGVIADRFDKRMVLVAAASALARERPEDSAPAVFSAAQNVALELVEVAPGGWLRVRHADGATGFMRATALWGN